MRVDPETKEFWRTSVSKYLNFVKTWSLQVMCCKMAKISALR